MSIYSQVARIRRRLSRWRSSQAHMGKFVIAEANQRPLLIPQKLPHESVVPRLFRRRPVGF